MRPLTDAEMHTYSKALVNQGLVSERAAIHNGEACIALAVTKKGNDYVCKFIEDKPEMFLLIFLDIMAHQKELNNG